MQKARAIRTPNFAAAAVVVVDVVIVVIMCTQDLHYRQCRSHPSCRTEWLWRRDAPRPCYQVQLWFPRDPEHHIGTCEPGVVPKKLRHKSTEWCAGCRRKKAEDAAGLERRPAVVGRESRAGSSK